MRFLKCKSGSALLLKSSQWLMGCSLSSPAASLFFPHPRSYSYTDLLAVSYTHQAYSCHKAFIPAVPHSYSALPSDLHMARPPRRLRSLLLSCLFQEAFPAGWSYHSSSFYSTLFYFHNTYHYIIWWYLSIYLFVFSMRMFTPWKQGFWFVQRHFIPSAWLCSQLQWIEY